MSIYQRNQKAQAPYEKDHIGIFDGSNVFVITRNNSNSNSQTKLVTLTNIYILLFS